EAPLTDAIGSPRSYRFGVFQLDPASGELRKNGMKIKLQGQPIDILSMLLERPGEVVSRDEIQKKLWPDGTIVEFDHSLNAAVKRLRDALDDSADTPRYIETLPKRGYRFIGQPASAFPGDASEHSAASAPDLVPAQVSAERVHSTHRVRYIALAAVPLVL